MKQLTLLSIIVLLAIQSYAGGNNYAAQWEKGNSFYRQKQYDSAVACFEQIAALKPYNTEVYYNLGNAYFRLNKTGPAVLNYERALRADPDNKAAKDNLLVTQSRISNRIQAGGDVFFIRWWQALTRPGKANAWAIMALVSFTLLIVLIIFKRITKPGTYTLPVQVNGLLALLFVCCFLFAYCAAANARDNSGAVVMEKDAPLMNGELKGKPILLVPEGTTVHIKNEKGSWAEVSLPDGRSGWLQMSVLARIMVKGI